ncbi:MAG: bifunctional pyr operon transcriptional regulator/uracil phosphoribosyltransferase PyrR [Myxococcales bacterium]|nr:bifunctional pyr operon transcriptional regulator/uracil phosphoribosyltransferase PyrR [Myxococcales bacterium]MCB9524341.1 bifunctional pyr operon transcriptional regulator/uracil phosphoribosyltransferase PyrR [Myxococcales bacterium]
MVERRLLMERVDVTRALRRIALQVIERVKSVDRLALVGVRTRGVPLAKRLQTFICEAEGVRPPVGELDITLYRDDVFDSLAVPEVKPTHLPFDVSGRHLVLVDDVLFTGRTTRAALDALMDWGRPKTVQLAVLVDRGHRELPLHADFVGMAVETGADESVRVRLSEVDGVDKVVLLGPGGAK